MTAPKIMEVCLSLTLVTPETQSFLTAQNDSVHHKGLWNNGQQNNVLQSEQYSKMPIGGILTEETIKDRYLAEMNYASGDPRNKPNCDPAQPNIFFNSLTEKDKNRNNASQDGASPVSLDSGHKLQKLLYRKMFRMKAYSLTYPE